MWQVRSTEKKYANNFFELYEDQVIQPDGSPGTYAIVHMKQGAAVLAVDDQNHVYLTKQYRYVYRNTSLEVVSGGIDGDEPALEAARRELYEEAGILADDWTELGVIQMDTSIVLCPIHLFVAKGLRFDQPDQDATEAVQLLRLPFEEALQKTLQGEIVHAPSVILIMKAHIAGVIS